MISFTKCESYNDVWQHWDVFNKNTPQLQTLNTWQNLFGMHQRIIMPVWHCANIKHASLIMLQYIIWSELTRMAVCLFRSMGWRRWRWISPFWTKLLTKPTVLDRGSKYMVFKMPSKGSEKTNKNGSTLSTKILS